MQRAEAERKPLKRDYEIGFDIDRLEADAADQHDLTNDVTDGYASLAVTEVDVEPEDLQVDLNLTHQVNAIYLQRINLTLFFVCTILSLISDCRLVNV